ncbi:MAG: hypothetical protein JWN32_2430 [Solirubrobacterales bacterium]|nr:hypothetical protein [Solirubrobacterales bacterium]
MVDAGGVVEKLVNLHLIETGTSGRESLFEVSLLLDESSRDALRDGDRDEWRRALGRARRLIDSHVAEKRSARGIQ